MWDKPKQYYLWRKIAWATGIIFGLSIIRILFTMDYSEPFGYWIMIHKLGEVFLVVPFWRAGMLSTYQGSRRVSTFLRRWQYVMLAGGIMNLVAGQGLAGEVWWDWFCNWVFIGGVLAQPLGEWLFVKKGRL